MAQYIIEGGKKLSGTVRVSGNKNSVLPVLAASILTEDKVTIKNVPNILDVEIFLKILKELGTTVERSGDQVKLKTKKISTTKLSPELTSKLRASVLLAGPLLARKGSIEFSHPGGDIIGKRSLETHINGFEKLGFEVKTLDRLYKIKKSHKLRMLPEVFLLEASVTATENLLLATALSESGIVLKNCATEPSVVDLCKILMKMGVVIEGTGTQTLKITGKNELRGVVFDIGPDYIEFATYAVAAAITGGEITATNIDLTNMEPVVFPLEKMGVNFKQTKDGVIVSAKKLHSIPKLVTNIWPGFPTDLMSVFIVLATQARGVSLMHDWMYESRMFFADKLISMGANITIADPHRVLVYGPTPLSGRELESPDIRAGMALLLAGLIAKGKCKINRAELIERGYGNVTKNLQRLGADIQKTP